MRRCWTMAALGLFLVVRSASAQVTLEAFSGTAYNLHTHLGISQEGEPDLGFSAHYETRPLEDTPYFGARISLWKNDRAWVGTFVHHKLYLANPPSEVQWFRITFGFNMATVGLRWRHGNLIYGLSAGPVITHASNSVRGKRYQGTGGLFNKGYRITGVTALGSLQYRVPLIHSVFLSGETMVSASYVEVKVNGGKAQVPAVAVHLHAGLGVGF